MILKTLCFQIFFLLVKTEREKRSIADSVTYYAIAGRRAILLCPINFENESVELAWEKDANLIYADQEFISTYSDRYKILQDNKSFHKKLLIENVTIEDAGVFLCFASCCLEEYTMQLIIVDVPVVHFNNNVFYCNANHWPQRSTVFSWEYQSAFGEQIRFINASDSASHKFDVSETESVYKKNGKYLCIVKSDVIALNEEIWSAAIEVKTEGKPTCVWTNEIKEIIYGMMGSTVSLEVFVYSVPSFDMIVWLQGEHIINRGIGKYRFYNISKVVKTNAYGSKIQLLVFSVILKIGSLTKEDFMNYTASIVNTQGECNCTVELRVAAVPVDWLLIGGISIGFVLIMVISLVLCFVRRRAGNAISLSTENYDEIGTVHYHSITTAQLPEAVGNVAVNTRNDAAFDSSSVSDGLQAVAGAAMENTNNADGYEHPYNVLSQNRGEGHFYSLCILPDEQIFRQEGREQMSSINEYVNLKL